MDTFGGYTKEAIAHRAAKRGRTFDAQFALDTRNSAQKVRDKKGRGRIEPPAPKDRRPAVSAPANKGAKRR